MCDDLRPEEFAFESDLFFGRGLFVYTNGARRWARSTVAAAEDGARIGRVQGHDAGQRDWRVPVSALLRRGRALG